MSCEAVRMLRIRNKNEWRLRIKGQTGKPRFTGKMAAEVADKICPILCNTIQSITVPLNLFKLSQ